MNDKCYGTSNQEIFDRVYDVFVTQKFGKCIRDIIDPKTLSNCLYFKPNHPGCAVGCQFKDEAFRKTLPDGLSVEGNAKLINAYIPHYANEGNAYFLRELQIMHDTYFTNDPENNKSKLEFFARQFDVKVPT